MGFFGCGLVSGEPPDPLHSVTDLGSSGLRAPDSSDSSIGVPGSAGFSGASGSTANDASIASLGTALSSLGRLRTPGGPKEKLFAAHQAYAVFRRSASRVMAACARCDDTAPWLRQRGKRARATDPHRNLRRREWQSGRCTRQQRSCQQQRQQQQRDNQRCFEQHGIERGRKPQRPERR